MNAGISQQITSIKDSQKKEKRTQIARSSLTARKQKRGKYKGKYGRSEAIKEVRTQLKHFKMHRLNEFAYNARQSYLEHNRHLRFKKKCRSRLSDAAQIDLQFSVASRENRIRVL